MANTMLKSTSFVGQQISTRPARSCPAARGRALPVAATADRKLFFPGAAAPEYLNDTLAGKTRVQSSLPAALDRRISDDVDD